MSDLNASSDLPSSSASSRPPLDSSSDENQNSVNAFLKKPGVLPLTVPDKAILYSAYMPFLKNGGLFIPSNKAYELGDEVFLLLSLMGEPTKLPIAGKVVWITPTGAQGNRVAGIGVQFNEEESVTVRNKIETYLAGALQSDRPTHTL